MRARLQLFSASYKRIRSCLIPVLYMVFMALPSYADDFTVKNIGDYGNVTVMEASGNFDELLPDGTENVAARKKIAREFFLTHKDEYDFVAIFTNFDYKMKPDRIAYYSQVKNDVRGIGQDIFDQSSLYGSNGKLQGTIDMGNLLKLTTSPLDAKFEFVVDELSHEMLHRFGAYAKFKDWNGNVSDALLGFQKAHWSFLLDSGASTHLGNYWQDNGNGTFTSLAARKYYYSPLDLYLMGMIPKEQVPPMLLIENSAIDPARKPEAGVTISGIPHKVTIDDIIAAMGERVPSAKDSQKQFKLAFIFAASPGSFKGDEVEALETLRNSFLTRQSILTDGKVLVQVASTPKDNLPVNPGVRPPTKVPRILPPNIDDGVKWLATHQMTDGSWTDFALTTDRDTAETVTTLQNFPVVKQQFLAGLQWLGSSAPANTDFLARRLEATIQAGGYGSTLQSELLARRNPDGGWGSGRNFISNPTDTALALKALIRAGYSDQQVIGSAVASLQMNQKSDGGWSGDDTVSAIQPTAAVLSAFNNCRKSYPLESNISRAIAFLTGKQNPDGGLGNSPSTVYDSAVAVMALQEAGADKAIINNGLNYLTGLQSENGSWQESPYQTALAVRAVWQATVDPDLAINSADITFIPERVTSLPTNAVVSAVIWNQGRSDVAQAKVAIYDGGIALEKKVAEQIVAFPGMSPVTVTFSVPITDGNGHLFYVVIDPENLAKESNKNNNIAAKSILPEVTFDFEVLPAYVTVVPSQVDIGQTVQITAKIANHGTMDGYSVPLRCFIDDPAGAVEVASATVDIPAGGSVTRTVSWTPNRTGSYLPLSVMVDPANSFNELREDNNKVTAQLTVNAVTLPNLTVTYKDLGVTPNPVLQGGDVHIALQVKNAGYSPAANVKVSFYNGAPDNGGVLIGTQTLTAVNAGESVATSFDWRNLAEPGAKIVYVRVDAENAIAESSKQDNDAFATLSVLSLPDLAVSSSSVVLSPAVPKEGDAVTVAVTVQNAGDQDAANVAVQLSDGAAVVGSALIAQIKGHSQESATIQYSAAGQGGSHSLKVVVDPDNKIAEISKDNNVAIKAVAVQNGKLWLSEPYFSPNGDGVKDSTQLSFRLDTSSTVKVVVNNSKGTTVRTFNGGELDNSQGSVVSWDGRDDVGMLAADGEYQFQILTSGNVVIGSLPVVVDNNRRLLSDDLGSSYVLKKNIPSPYNGNLGTFNWKWAPDSSGFIYFDSGYSEVGGYYYMSLRKSPIFGTDAETVYYSKNASYLDAVMSDKAEKFAYAAPLTSSTSQVCVATTDGATTSCFSTGSRLISPSSFSPDNKYLLGYEVATRDMWVLKADGSSMQDIGYGYWGNNHVSWSPDSKRFFYHNQPDIVVVDVSGSTAVSKIYAGLNNSVSSDSAVWFNNMIFAPGSYSTYVLDLDNPANSKYVNWGGVTLSPDQRYIAYRNYDQGSSVSIMDTNGNSSKVVDTTPSCWYGYSSMSPLTWSPDSKQLALMYKTFCQAPIPDKTNVIFVVDAASGTTRKVIPNQTVVAGEPFLDFLRWNLDAKSIYLNVPNSKTVMVDLNTGADTLVDSPSEIKWNTWDDPANMLSPNGSTFVSYQTEYPYLLKGVISVANLTASVSPVYKPSSVLLKGTAADMNFAGYRLEYAPITTPEAWKPIAPDSDTMVVDNVLGEWVPPAPGNYFVKLTAWDKAGNVATDRKRVTFGQQVRIGNLRISASQISPNSDGLKDGVDLSYTIYSPLHLEAKVYDAKNSVVRSFVREYASPVDDSISWDGRDGGGNMVADGVYTIKVLDYAFAVMVDTTIPSGTLGLSPIQYSVDYNAYYVDLNALAFDANIKGWKIEYGEGINPNIWLEYKSGSANLSSKDSLGNTIYPPQAVQVRRFFDQDIAWLKGKKLRITVEDLAGNVTTGISDAVQEQVLITKWDDLSTTQMITPDKALPGPHSVHGFDTTALPTASIVLQYWNGQQWADAATADDISTSSINLAWDTGSLGLGDGFGVRAKVVDIEGGAHFSNTLSAGALFSLNMDCSFELVGKNILFENLSGLRLQVMSGQDTNYAQWTDYKVFDAGRGDVIPTGGFLAPLPPFKSGMSYQLRMIGTAPNGSTYTTPPTVYPPKCPVKIGLGLSFEEANGCGATSPGKATLSAKVEESAGRVDFKTLSYYLQKPEGQQLLKSYDLIREGWRALPLSTAELTEGSYLVKAVVSYFDEGDGQMKDAQASKQVKVDRVLPISIIIYPGQNAKLCPVKMAGTTSWLGIPVDVTVSDNNEVGSYQLYYGSGENPSSWLPATSPALENGQLTDKPIAGKGSLQGRLGVWDISRLKGGTYTLKLKVVDGAGNVNCSTTTIWFDNSIEIGSVSADKPLISPNGDGTLDAVTLSLQMSEAATVDIKVARALENGGIDPVPLATVVSLHHLPGTESILWDGKDASGARVADGRYALTATASDSCGNSTMKWVPVEVDATAPTVSISYPTASQQLPPGNLIEVKGSVNDLHLQSYTLEAGEGENPALWSTVAGGALPVDAGIIGAWNTYGHVGKWTVRLAAVDRAGNKSSTTSVIDLGTRKSLVKSVAVTPKLFSPNGDGKLDAALLNYEVTDVVQASVEIADAAGAVVRSYTTGLPSAGASSYSWNGKNNAGAPVADGSYQLKLTAQLSSNPAVTQTETVTTVLDTTKPLIDVRQPADKAYLDRNSLGVTGTISDLNLASYSLKVTGPSSTVVLQDSGNQSRTDYTFGTISDLPEGDYTLSADSKDLGENAASFSRSFTIDRTLPKVTLDSPKNDENFAGKSVVVSGSLVEKNLDRFSLRYGAGDAPTTWTEMIGGDTFPATNPLWNWKVGKDDGVADGVYTISLYARDKAGHEGEAKAKIVVDNTAPQAAITSPKDGDYVKGAMYITGTASDANLDHATLELSEGACSAAYKWVTMRALTASIKDGTLESWKVLPGGGDYCLRLTVTDKAGNKSEVKNSVKIDAIPPAAPVLTAKVVNNAAALEWTSSDADVVGYDIYRDGVKLNSSPITVKGYSDATVKEGTHSYLVKAIDAAGNVSDASATVKLRVDLSGPDVAISAPGASARVGALAEIKGTAFSSDDFKEYRVFFGAGPDPAAWNLIRISGVAVSSGTLAKWDTTGLADGTYTVKLEGEDLSGNISTQRVTVTLDNTAPLAPMLVSATAISNNATITWRANSESDMGGYLLYRNNQLVNGSGSAAYLQPFLVSGTSYTDSALADGQYVYQLYAMDRAGNLSNPSNSVTLVVDIHPPHATIFDPASGVKTDSSIAVKAQCPDLDVKSVQFQFKRAQDSSWTNLCAAVATTPYAVTFDPKGAGLAYADYQVRPVATDNGGKTDTAPAYITITYTDLTPPAVPTGARAAVNGNKVTLSWGANTESDLNGYNIYRTSGTTRTKVNSAVLKTLLYQDLNLADGDYSYEITAVDSYGNESASCTLPAKVYAPVVLPPPPISSKATLAISGIRAPANASVEFFSETAAGIVSAGKVTADDKGNFTLPSLALAAGDLKITAQATDAAGNTSRSSDAYTITYKDSPSAPTGLAATVQNSSVALAWNANPEAGIAGYNVFRDGTKLNIPVSQYAGSSSASSADYYYSAYRALDGASYTAWRATTYDASPIWWEFDLPSSELISHLDIHWMPSYPGKDYLVQGWSGTAWVTLKRVSGNAAADSSFDFAPSYRTGKIRIYITDVVYNVSSTRVVGINEVNIVKDQLVAQPSYQDVNLPRGTYSYMATAVDTSGLESLPSEDLKTIVGDIVPPAAPSNVVATGSGTEINVTWIPNQEPDLAGYWVYKETAQGWAKLNTVLLTATSFRHSGLDNGSYKYRVTAVDLVGNEGMPSTEASAIIAVALPSPPAALRADAVPEGATLKLTWEPTGVASSFDLYRSNVTGGRYVKINSVPIAGLSYLDRGLVNGVTYYYVAVAADEVGNQSVYSQEASGVPVDTAIEKPGFWSPAQPGMSGVVQAGLTDITGSAEPGATVELFRDGQSLGKTETYASDLSQTTSVPYNGTGYSVSPDGALLAYYDNATYYLSIKNLSTGVVTPFARYGSSPQWSPDGNKIAAVYYSSSNRIGIFDRSTGTLSPATSDVNPTERYPFWSADGMKVVFVSNKGGYQDVWVKDIVSGTLSQVTNGVNASYPQLSPDGNKLLYFQGLNLVVKDLESGSATVVDSKGVPGNASWSRDGKRVSYVSSRTGNDDVHVFNTETGSLQQITTGPNVNLKPVWSPDDQNIAFITKEQNGTYSLKVTETNGGSRALQSGLSNVSSVAWEKTGAVSCVSVDAITTAYAKGFFTFTDVDLQPGQNFFYAVATDTSGNVSQPSDDISIVYDSSQMPDLSISSDGISILPAYPKPGSEVVFIAAIKNQRQIPISNVDVELYLWGVDGELKLLKSLTIPLLGANAEERISVSVNAGDHVGAETIIAIVDPANSIGELLETNNYAAKEFYITDKEEFAVTTALNAGEFTSNQDTAIRVTLGNSGMPKDGLLNVVIKDESGNLVALLESVPTIVSYGSDNRSYKWNTGATFAGAYQVHAVFAANDGTVTESSTPFTILPDIRVDSGVVTDRQGYGANDSVKVTLSLKNSGSNYLVQQLKARVRIVDFHDAALFTDEKTVRNLFPAMDSSFVVLWNTGLNLPGGYRVVVEAYLDDKLVSSSFAKFAINPVSKVSGTVIVDPAAVLIGNNLKTAFTVANSGNIGTSGSVRAVIVSPESGAILATAEQPVTLAMGSSQAGEFSFQTQGLELKSYLLSLQYASQGNQKSIASASFTVKDGTAPVVTIVSPLAGTSYNATIPIVALASDNASGVERVEYQVDGGPWKLLPLADPAKGRYAAAWEPTFADNGFHNVSFRGTDRAGNTSVPVTVRIEIQMDNTPPVSLLTVGAEQYGTEGNLYISGRTGLTITATDSASGVRSSEFSIDGAPFVAYSASFTLAAYPEGSHTITYRSTDNVGNVETAKQLTVVLDKAPPKTVVAGSDPLADGVVNTVSPVTSFTLTATDNLSGVNNIWYRIDGGQWQLFTAGFTLAGLKEGPHVIAFNAVDNVGNEEPEHAITVRLILAEVKKEISLEPVVLVGAWLDNLNKVKNQSATDGIRSILTPLGISFRIAEDGDDFKGSLRSGRYTTYLLVDYKDEKVGGELREAVNYGDGLIFIKTRPSADPVLDEVLGAKFTGKTTSDGLPVNLTESPLGPAATIQSSGKSVVTTVEAATAQVYGYVDDKKSQYPSVICNEYGNGKVLLFTFDLLNSADREKVAGLIGNSITLLKPDQYIVRALDSVPVRITVASSTEPFGLRVTETIPAGTTADTIIPQGMAAETSITWQQYLEASARAQFGYYLNLPDAKGEYMVTTDVGYANHGDYRPYETAQLTATVRADSADLLRGVINELNAIPVAGSNDLVILNEAVSRLSQVTTYPLDGKEAEKGVETVTTVTKLIRGLSADTADVRLKLDELLKILERKWYLINLREQTG